MLVTFLAILVTNIHYLFTLVSGTNIQKVSPTSQSRSQLLVTNITVTIIEFLKNCSFEIGNWNFSFGVQIMERTLLKACFRMLKNILVGHEGKYFER